MSARPSPIERRALTIDDFCKMFGVGRTTTKQLISDGKLVRRYVGRRSIIDFDSAVAWHSSLPTDSPDNVKKTARNLDKRKTQ